MRERSLLLGFSRFNAICLTLTSLRLAGAFDSSFTGTGSKLMQPPSSGYSVVFLSPLSYVIVTRAVLWPGVEAGATCVMVPSKKIDCGRMPAGSLSSVKYWSCCLSVSLAKSERLGFWSTLTLTRRASIAALVSAPPPAIIVSDTVICFVNNPVFSMLTFTERIPLFSTRLILLSCLTLFPFTMR
jgi:hypothetical protein